MSNIINAKFIAQVKEKVLAFVSSFTLTPVSAVA
jgi:hypothetical protein